MGVPSAATAASHLLMRHPHLPAMAPPPSPLGIQAPSTDPSQAWYADHGPTVYRYLRFQVLTADDAEDLTAETFLRVVRSADRFVPERGNARTWILRIARNVLRDYYRAQRVRHHVSLGSLRDLAVDAPSVEERLLWEEEVTTLLAALETLGADDREVLSLRYGSDLSTAELAEVLHTREATVRTKVWRALTRLRKALLASGRNA